MLTATRPLRRLRGTLRDFKKMLLISFEIVVYGGGLLILPCAMAGLLSDSLVSDLVAAVVVVAAVGTAILTAIAIHEGWFLKHLSDWRTSGKSTEPVVPAQAGRTVAANGIRATLEAGMRVVRAGAFVVQMPAP